MNQVEEVTCPVCAYGIHVNAKKRSTRYTKK
eukprot:SAG22_NODE_3920_length_1467_cov_1.812865_2_plen_31_part_00